VEEKAQASLRIVAKNGCQLDATWADENGSVNEQKDSKHL
jgi:hypothetical protein